MNTKILFGSSQSPSRLALVVSLGFALFFLGFLPPCIYSIDGNSMLAVSEALVANHNLQVPQGLGTTGRDGHVYSNWYPLLSVTALPFVALAHVSSQTVHLPFHFVAALFALIVQVPLSAATAGFVALLSFQLGASPRGAWLASLTFGLGTVAMVYVRTFYAEPLLAFLVVFALYLAFRLTPLSVGLCSFVALLAVLAKPSGIFVGVVVTGYLLAKRIEWRTALLPTLGSLAGVLIYAGYNQLRFGHPLQFGPPWNFVPSAVPSGLVGLLVSPGWGLVWYCPALVLSVIGFVEGMRSRTYEVCAIVAIFGAFLFFHSIYFSWSGGWSWGPRYLVPGIPGLCGLTSLLPGRGRKALIFLTVVGFLINAPTLFSFYERYLAELQESGVSNEAAITWSVRQAPLFHVWPAGIRQVKDASRNDVRELFAKVGSPSKQINTSRQLRIVAIWWWLLPIAGIPQWLGFLLSLAMVTVGVVVLFRCAPPPIFRT